MLDVNRLRVLLAVVEQGSVTAAGAQLGYSPSAISQQIRRLEKEVGQPLLHRHARGTVPTDAGQTLALHARQVMRQLSAAEADLAEIAGLRRGRLDLGVFPTVGGSFVPIAVRRFREHYPGVELTIHSAREAELIAMVEDGRTGLTLLWDYTWARLDPKRLALTPLFTDPTVLVVSDEHRLAHRKAVSMADLADEDWVVRAEHPVIEVLRRSAVKAGFTPRISFRANDYQEAQAMVSVGLGIALAPRTALVNKHPKVRLLSLGESAPARRVVVAHRHDRVRAPAEIGFHRLVVETAAEYEPGDF